MSSSGVLSDLQNAQEALRAAGVCFWEWDAERDEIRWSGAVDGLVIELPTRFDDFASLARDEDRGRLDTALKEFLARRTPLAITFRSPGSLPLRATGQAAWRDDGAPRSMSGCLLRIPSAAPAPAEGHGLEGADCEHESRFRALIDHAPVCVHEISLTGEIASMNRAGLDMISLSDAEQIIGTPYLACVSKADQPRVAKLLEEAFAGQPAEFEFASAGRTPRCFASSLVPLRDAGGNIYRLMGITSDITEERNAREKLARNEERYQLAERVARVGVWEWELESNRVFLTDETKRMLALPKDKDEYSIDSIINRVDAAHRPMWRESVQHCLEHGTEHHLEFRVINADGAVTWLAALADARRDDDGRPTHLLGVMTEITDRKRGELALRESEERFQLAVRGSTDGIWDWNIQTGQVFYSARYKELVGYGPHEPFPADLNAFTQMLHPDDLDPTWAAVNEHLETKGAYDREFRLRTKSGSYRWFRARGQAVWDREGQPTRMAGSIQDVTAKREARRLLREVVDHVPHEIFAKDSAGRFVMSNRKHAADLDMTPEQVVGKLQTEITPDPSQAAAFLADDREVIRSGRPKLVPEEAFTTPQGERVILQTHKIPLTLADDSGESQGILGVAIDITGLKQTEAQLREREEQLRALVENTSDWVWEMNTEGFHTYSNGRIVEILGYSASEFNKIRVFELFHEDEREAIGAMVQNAIAEKRGWKNFVLRLRSKSGEYRYLESSAAPVIDARGFVVGFRGIDRDITDRKLEEEEREKLIRELEEKNAELELFTYTVSHDLKSPLITIKGFLGLLERDLAKPDLDTAPSRMRRIRKASDQMSQLLDELLQLSRIGRVTNRREAISLSEIAAEAVDLTSGLIVERGVSVTVQPNLPIVFVDRKRLLEVLQNLIDNACRFGRPGDAEVEVNVRVDDGQNVFYVRDNGIGIPSKYHDKVLGLFEQLDPEQGGTGIGLAIVKRIIEVHNGRVWIESDGADAGTTVCFTVGEDQA